MSYRQERTRRSGPVGTYLTFLQTSYFTCGERIIILTFWGGWVPHLAHGCTAQPNPGQAVNDTEKQHGSRFQVCETGPVTWTSAAFSADKVSF